MHAQVLLSVSTGRIEVRGGVLERSWSGLFHAAIKCIINGVRYLLTFSRNKTLFELMDLLDEYAYVQLLHWLQD